MSGRAWAGPALEALYAWRGWVLAALFAVVAASRALSDAPLQPLGLAPAVLGAAWRLQAGRFIRSHSNGARMASGPLASAGPYSLGRHPLYLSNILSAAGLILFADSLPAWGMALLFAAVCLHHALLASEEERRMVSAHGEAYLGYMRATPRWIGLTGRRAGPGPRGTARPAGGDGLARAVRRQGGNLAKLGAAFLVLWGLARPW